MRIEVLIGIGILFVIWFLKSIKIVGPAEMAIKIIFGRPISFCGSGFRFVPWLPGCYLKTYPKKRYNLDFPAKEAVTKEGEYGGKKYGAITVKIDAVAYLTFPRDENLIEIMQAQVPTEEKELLTFVEDSVVGALRVVAGQMTWREVIENMKEVENRAEGLFKATDGALLKSGFKEEDLSLVITEVILPPQLAETLPAVDVERIKAEAAESVAEAQAKTMMGTAIRMFCEATGKPLKEVQEKIAASPEISKEFRLQSIYYTAIQEAMKNKSYLRVEVNGAEGAEKAFLNFLSVIKSLPLQKGGESKEGQKEVEKKRTTKEAFGDVFGLKE